LEYNVKRFIIRKFAKDKSNMKLQIYIDTSVFGGYYDKEFYLDTQQLFDRIRNKDFIVIVSDITKGELEFAPEKVRDLFNEIPKECLKEIELSEEAQELAQKYILEKVVGKSSLTDAQHIATASTNRSDVLISWNFKHIVNLDKIRGYNSVNLRLNYPVIEIRSPKELVKYENND
jgi:hypothetical protein